MDNIIAILVGLNLLSAYIFWSAYRINQDDIKSGLYSKDDPHPIWIMTPFAAAAPAITLLVILHCFFPIT